MTELRGRLVNLDVAPGFTSVAPVLGNDPVGPLTGAHYSNSLVQPDRTGVEPRIGISWRPMPASTIVIRAGYGIYHDTSVYLNPVLQLAQQAPLSKSVKEQNSAACPLSLANGFIPCDSTTSQTFGLDPHFRVGYAQNWNLALQRDLPGAMQLTATYLGVKGTHGVQEFLPNSYPLGALDPCPECPSGFIYETSGGNSTRQSGQVQLRRRLKGGFTALMLYTYSKSIDDDAALGGQGHTSSASQSGLSDNETLTFVSRACANCLDCARLARPARGTLSLIIRPASSSQSAGAIHHGAGARRRHIIAWVAGPPAQGVDSAYTNQRGHRATGNARVPGRGPGNGLDRFAAAQPHRRAHLRPRRDTRISTRRLMPHPRQAHGAPRRETPFAVRTHSASMAPCSAPSGPRLASYLDARIEASQPAEPRGLQ